MGVVQKESGAPNLEEFGPSGFWFKSAPEGNALRIHMKDKNNQNISLLEESPVEGPPVWVV